MKDILKRLTYLNEKFVTVERELESAKGDYEVETEEIKSFKNDFDAWTLTVENHIEEDHFYIKDDIEDLETLCGKLKQRIEELERRCGGSCND